MSENFTLDSFVNLHKDEVKEILSLPEEPTTLDAAELVVDHEIEDYLDGQNPHLQDLADEYGVELKNVLMTALTESLTEAEVAPVSYQDFMIDGYNGVLMVFEDNTAVGIADIDGNVRYYEGNIQNEEFYTTAEFEDYQSILNKLPEDYKNEWREFATEYSQKITDKLGDSIMRESQEENNMLSNPNVEDVVRHIYVNRSNYGDDYEFLSPDEVARLAEELGIENLTHNEIAAISYEMDKLAEELDLSNEPEEVIIDIDAKDFVVGDENMEDQNIDNNEDIEDVDDFEESLLNRFNATKNALVEQYKVNEGTSQYSISIIDKDGSKQKQGFNTYKEFLNNFNLEIDNLQKGDSIKAYKGYDLIYDGKKYGNKSHELKINLNNIHNAIKESHKIRRCNNLAERHKLAESLFKDSGRVPISRKALEKRLGEKNDK